MSWPEGKPKRSADRHRTVDGVGLDGASSARLIAVSGSRTGCKYVIEDEVTLGRSGECAVVVDNAECSRQHARIRRVPHGFLVSDLGSRNGTIVNGQRIEGEHTLAFGDRLRIGPHDVFLFTPHDPIEEQLLHRQRLETLGRLTAGVAHDLNNMLGAVKASVDFIRTLPSEARNTPEAEGCLDDISTASARAADLAGRLLSFARASGDHTAANISDIVNEAVTLARRTFDRTITIDADVQPSIYVEGDPTQLHQVLMNLLVNARDAADAQGNIWITVQRSPETHVSVRVRDDGCGMSEATQNQIFEPFYTTKRPGAGFGLGLATVADIVRSHGGDISVHSLLDEGTTFTITLPTTKRPAKSSNIQTLDDLDAGPRSAKGLRVALVDDEPVMRRSLARVFRHAGFTVRSFETGEEALEALRPGKPSADALVLDLDLPGISGEETLRRLRAMGTSIPVICISGHHDQARQVEVTARGAAAFLGKPFEPAQLVKAVFDAIDNEAESSDTKS